MGFLIDLLFGTKLSSSFSDKKRINSGLTNFDEDYDDYFEQLHDDAMCGDLDGIDEMEEEFGDDWEGEY